jgi:hypothetical protein
MVLRRSPRMVSPANGRLFTQQHKPIYASVGNTGEQIREMKPQDVDHALGLINEPDPAEPVGMASRNRQQG